MITPDISIIEVIAIPEILSHLKNSLLTPLILKYIKKVSSNPDDIVVYLVGPAGAFERKPTVLNPVAPSKP